MPLFAKTSLVVDPVWPWSSTSLGWPALLLIALVVAGLTVLTYLLSQRATFGQFAAVLTLRLLALLIAILLMLRPSIAHQEQTITPSKLLILLDSSRSMSNKDEYNNKTRWEAAWRLLQSTDVKTALEKLKRNQRMEVLMYEAAEKVTRFDPDAVADGKRTDMGYWLNSLYKKHGNDSGLRGMLILSDGADNGAKYPTLEEAKNWRAIGSPIHTFGLGNPKTTADEEDIYFVADKIFVSPSPVPAKGKMKIKTVVNAPGFVNANRPLRLFLNDKQVEFKNITLALRENNQVEMVTDAPAKSGDYKVTLKIDPLKAEISDRNNEISTYVDVTKEGLSVLWVEGKKRLEATWVLRHVLLPDAKVRVYYAERLKTKEALAPGEEDWFRFEKQHYDVIVIGDISGSRFAGGNPEVFGQIEKLVAEDTGLLMLGGYETFANSDWQQYPEFTKMLPVILNQPGQIENAAGIRMLPTSKQADHFLMRLADNRKVNEQLWKTKFQPLPGVTPLGTVRPEAVVLAGINGDETKPLMAFKNYGGRVLVFGADTTHLAWTRSYAAFDAYKRFWRQLVYWLAGKDEPETDVWVEIDMRRLPAGNNHPVGITVGLKRGDAKKQYKNVTFQVEVVGPDKEKTIVPTFPQRKSDELEQRGSFWKTNLAGEYTVQVFALDEKGNKINETAPATARFLTYASDLENLRPAADHIFLSKLAAAGGGQFRLANKQELVELLTQLAEKTDQANLSQKSTWPDWNRDPVSSAPGDQVSSLITSGILFAYLIFCALLCTEWYLRRRWSMV